MKQDSGSRQLNAIDCHSPQRWLSSQCYPRDPKCDQGVVIIYVDAAILVFYYPLNTGKEVIEKYMSSYHSEVAAA